MTTTRTHTITKTHALAAVPVTTIIHIIVALVGAILLIIHGNLGNDFLVYAGVIEGGNGALSIGRALDSTSKP